MVDVIICVHDAYEDVIKCLHSVISNSDIEYKLIVVDDGSQKKTRDYLREIYSQGAISTLVRNEEGHGYTYAVNMGIDHSQAEYKVLLNSDTIVPKNWLSQLIKPLMNNDDLGITGPLSNSATWQSIPYLYDWNGDFANNTIPRNITVEEYSMFIYRNLKKGLIYVPLLNGFCMAIKKSVIDSVGKFDITSFPKGYGEEDDFNIRAQKKGFKLAIVTGCYVYHAHSKSYTDEKRIILTKQSGQMLIKKHGKQVIKDKVDHMRNNAELALLRQETRNAMKRAGMECISFLPQSIKEVTSKGKLIYVYGAGAYAKKYTQLLGENDCKITGYVVSTRADNPDSLFGKTILTIDELCNICSALDDIAILIAVKRDYEIIVEQLFKRGFVNVYVLGK